MCHPNNEMQKKQMTEGIDKQLKKKIRKLGEKETFKYLVILKADTIKQMKMKEKIKKEHLKRTKKLLEIKLYCRNLIKGINTRAVPLKIPSELFLKWTRKELKQMNQ